MAGKLRIVRDSKGRFKDIQEAKKMRGSEADALSASYVEGVKDTKARVKKACDKILKSTPPSQRTQVEVVLGLLQEELEK